MGGCATPLHDALRAGTNLPAGASGIHET